MNTYNRSTLSPRRPEAECARIVGANVKRLRLAAKMNKYTFTLMLGIGRPYLNSIESGKANPRLSSLVVLAEALETTPIDLLTDHDVKDYPSHPPARGGGMQPFRG